MTRRDIGSALGSLLELLWGRGGTSRDEGSWGEATNDEVVPRELRWTIRDATNYGSGHQEPVGMEEENRAARLRLLQDIGEASDLTDDDPPSVPRGR